MTAKYNKVGGLIDLSANLTDLRQRAETKIIDPKHEIVEPFSLEEAQQLLHELRVYQLELEMQNQELQQAQATLEQARARYFDLYDLAPVAYVTVDEKHLILEANLTAATLFGDTREALIKRPLTDYIRPKDQDIYYLHCKALRTTGHPQICELQLRSSDGTLFWGQIKTMLVKDEEESAFIYRTIISDISQLKQIEGEKEELQQRQQQERLIAVGRLAAGIAHDFNNIIQAILMSAQMIEILATTDEITEDATVIIKQSQRAADLVRQILDFSGRSMTTAREQNLIPIIQTVVQILRRTIPENIRISLDIEPVCESYMVKIDETKLDQLLTNLALNAQVAMPQGGTLRFRLFFQHLLKDQIDRFPEMSPGNWLILTVTDSGHGIESDVLSRIFEPFFTTGTVGERRGLGLSQVYGIVQQHDGFIDVASRNGEGTTFTIYFPAIPATTSTPFPEKSVASIPFGDGATILLVEDEKLVLQTVKKTLELWGYKILSAENGRQALTIYEQHAHEIDLIITDMIMPQMGGEELVQIIHEQNPNVKIICMTGYTEVSANLVLSPGLIEWLPKPVEREQLLLTTSQLLQY